MTSFHVKKLGVTEIMICDLACGHKLRYHVRNDNTRKRMNVENTTEKSRKSTDPTRKSTDPTEAG